MPPAKQFQWCDSHVLLIIKFTWRSQWENKQTKNTVEFHYTCFLRVARLKVDQTKQHPGTCDSKACCCRGIVAWIFSESLSSLGLLIPRNVIKLVFAARNVICIVLTTVVFANLLAVFDALVTKLKFQCNT